MKNSILIISPFSKPNLGGVEEHLEVLYSYFKRYYKVFVITYQPLTTKARAPHIEKSKNLEIHRVGWFGRGLFDKLEPYPILEFLYLFPGMFLYSLYFMIKHNREIGAVHSHGINAALVSAILSKIFKANYIMTIHAIYNLDKRKLLARVVKPILSSLDYILPLAKRSEEDLVSAGIPKEKMITCNQWVDQNFFKPINKQECRKKLQIKDTDFVVLFAGRFIEKKGVRTLLEVASRLKGTKFCFIGDGPLRSEIQQGSVKNKNVILVGKVESLQLPIYFNAADVFALPSQYEEGFSRAIMEVVSCGTPVIASNKGCLPEMLSPDVSILVDPTVENLTKSIKYLKEHKQNLNKLRLNCRPYAESNFSEKNAKVIKNCYRGIV